MSAAHDRKAIEETDARRTVKIPTGSISGKDFDLSAGDRAWLYESGHQAGHRFLHGPQLWRFADHVTQRHQQATEQRAVAHDQSPST